jgi:hypothetical protein
MRYVFFILLLFACSNPSREIGSQSTDSTAVVQPADKTSVEKDSLTNIGTDTLRADSL